MVARAYRTVLRPETGLASKWGISPPDELPLWSIGIELNNGADDGRGPGLAGVAGAAGFERLSTIYRGVGEAVERTSLFPNSEDGDHLLGESLVDSAPCEVDRHEIDYPIDGGSGIYDSTPSGAAAGLSLDQATRAALVEQIERDALQVGWYRQDGLRRIDRTMLELLDDYPLALAAADSYGVELTVARLPVAHPDLVVIAVMAVDRQSSLMSVGMKASESSATAVVGAIAESLQIAHALKALVADGLLDRPLRNQVIDDTERARWLLEPSNADMVRAWFEASPIDDRDPTTESATIATADLVEAVAEDGGVPIRIDLTHRLPEPLREVDWCAVKVLVRGYQPLRMDETIDSNLVPDRIGEQVTTMPHPLI